MNGLVLVAHPDDEVIFAGALLLSTPEIEWTILCATYDFEHERGKEFLRSVEALRMLGARIGHAEMLGLKDTAGPVLGLPGYIEWERTIASAGCSPDVVYTHNRRGDYGHGHHMTVNAIAHSLYPQCKVWEFYYPRLTGVGYQWHGDHIEHCTSERKRGAFSAAYEHRLDGLLYHLPEQMRYLILDGQEMHTCASS